MSVHAFQAQPRTAQSAGRRPAPGGPAALRARSFGHQAARASAPSPPGLGREGASEPPALEEDRAGEQSGSASERTGLVAAGGDGVLRRKCACGGDAGPGGECEACKKKREATLQRSARAGAAGHGRDQAPAVVYDALRSEGRPLDPGSRAFFEPRMGYDLGRVRVHTGALAAESARAVNADAYTVGRDVVFAAGRFAPGTADGRKLLA
ncbi:MAG TPA: DUF4157 domain-containing protein, partial [bacterium]|nr:DUF4157 domain-containing protein [bacterium]